MLRKALWTGLYGALGAVAEPGTAVTAAASGPQPGRRAKTKDARNPFAVAGAAFATGAVLAKIIDWRGHAHPKR